jgi:hypothetical protein
MSEFREIGEVTVRWGKSGQVKSTIQPLYETFDKHKIYISNDIVYETGNSFSITFSIKSVYRNNSRHNILDFTSLEFIVEDDEAKKRRLN